MQIFTLQIFVTLQVLIWFDWLKPHHIIIQWLGFQKWTPKNELPLFWQWLGCYFCTSNWIGIINAGAYFGITFDLFGALTLIALNYIMSRLLDYLLGYQSFKP